MNVPTIERILLEYFPDSTTTARVLAANAILDSIESEEHKEWLRNLGAL